MKIFVFLAVLLLASVSAAAQHKVVTLATLTDFPPYCFNKEFSGHLEKEVIPPGKDSVRVQGYSWDVVRESYHAMEYTIVLYVLPWARVLHSLDMGRVEAIFPANRTIEREGKYIFSSEYVDRVSLVVYVPADVEREWTDLSSLNGLRVGAVRGWDYGKKWESSIAIKKEPMDTILQSFQVLGKKRLDAVVGYEKAYDYVLNQEKMAELFRKLGTFSITDEYVMAKKGSRSAQEKLEIFDRGHRLFAQRGGMDTLNRKWR